MINIDEVLDDFRAEALDPTSVRAWMLTNLDRFNIFVPESSVDLLPFLETYVRARIGSVFEGSA
jgi:hypothetical protein